MSVLNANNCRLCSKHVVKFHAMQQQTRIPSGATCKFESAQLTVEYRWIRGKDLEKQYRHFHPFYMCNSKSNLYLFHIENFER